MTRKHYVEIANILNQYQGDLGFSDNEIHAFDEMIHKLAFYFKLDNQNFDAKKFLNAVNKS